MTPFDIINAISYSKENLICNTANDELAQKAYVPFVINKGLSFYPDTVLYANEINLRPFLDKKPQFLYLLNSVRPRKRSSKWFKMKQIEEIDMISEYFKCNKRRAKDYIKILTGDQLTEIKQKLEKGG
jgi:hypothetical protein